ncbi:MAG: ECF-type sigma factor [Candidatus Moduliflexus flocculans]|nr:ECF-type sigma factor [Candidatus Moduliflexus flocculans]
MLYADLRRIAHAKLRFGHGPTLLDTTSLVHESYLRLVQLDQLRVQDRSYLFAYAARVMRSVIVDLAAASRGRAARWRAGVGHAGYRRVRRRTGGRRRDSGGARGPRRTRPRIDQRLVRVVEMRFFVGLDMEEIALALDVGKRTVERDWEKARSFCTPRSSAAERRPALVSAAGGFDRGIA